MVQQKAIKYAVFFFTLLLASSASAAQPAPLCKTLKIGALTYGSSLIWTNTARRDWWANRFYCGVGSAGTSSPPHIAAMKAINPELTFYYYDLYNRQAADTQYVKNWCAQRGFSSDSMMLRVSNSVDSFRVRTSFWTGSKSADGTGPFSWWRTSYPGAIIKVSGFTNAQTRFIWDFRNPKVGYCLAHVFDSLADLAGCDGIMIDEFSARGKTNMIVNGLDFPDIPTAYGRDTDPDSAMYHPVYSGSSIYRGLQRPWDSTFDLNTTGGVWGDGDADGTHSWTDVRDSLRRLYGGWAKMMGDSSRLKYGKELMINPASSMGNYNSTSNWTAEGRHLVGQWIGGMLMGEYCYYSPNTSGQEDYCVIAESCIRSLRDSSVRIAVWPIRVNPDDLDAGSGVTLGRMKHVALGMMLQCSFPGNSDVIFCLKSLIKVNWGLDTCYGASNGDADCSDAGENPVSDTLTTWDNSFGKYFGVFDTLRTTVSGTDGAGQSYRLRSGRTKKVNGDTLFVWYGRYASGNNRNPTNTNINATLGSYTSGSGDTYYELLPGGIWDPSPYTEGTVITIANAQFRFFATDTVLANQGVASTPSVSQLFVDSLRNDYSSEQDSAQVRTTTSAGLVASDSLIVVYNFTGFASLDSTAITNAIRRAATSSTTYTDTILFTQTETVTMFVAAWQKNATTGWSTRSQESRTFNQPPPPIVTPARYNGSITGRFRP